MRTDKRKIGFLILSPNWSGAENALKNILINLGKFGEETCIYCNSEICKYYVNIKGNQIFDLGPLNIKSKLRFINYINIKNKLEKILSNNRVGVLFIMLDGSFFVARGLNTKFKIPILLNLRGEEINNYATNKFSLGNIFIKYWIKNSEKIISVSSNQIEKFPEKYKQKTVTISNGVDLKLFKPLSSLKKKKNVVLFVGRLKKEKGIKEILTVAKQLPQYEFWFVGQGPLENLINLPNTKNFGFKSTEELVKLYNQATICISPSYREGFSNVGLEVLACGRVLICTPPFLEYIENEKDGIIIPTKDEKALKDAIVDLMTNEKKREILEKNARRKALQYSWDKVAEQYLLLCEGLSIK